MGEMNGNLCRLTVIEVVDGCFLGRRAVLARPMERATLPIMTLHLIKLCVGAESFDDHKAWVEATLARKQRLGQPAEQFHTTRMVPKRADELVDGGSLYWVIKGMVQARQRLLEIRPFTDDDGISRCHLVLEPTVIATRGQPRRPFQGWRYLKADDAPADLSDLAEGEGAGDLHPTMRQDLMALGLL